MPARRPRYRHTPSAERQADSLAPPSSVGSRSAHARLTNSETPQRINRLLSDRFQILWGPVRPTASVYLLRRIPPTGPFPRMTASRRAIIGGLQPFGGALLAGRYEALVQQFDFDRGQLVKPLAYAVASRCFAHVYLGDAVLFRFG